MKIHLLCAFLSCALAVSQPATASDNYNDNFDDYYGSGIAAVDYSSDSILSSDDSEAATSGSSSSFTDPILLDSSCHCPANVGYTKPRYSLLSQLLENTELRVAADAYNGFGDGRLALFNPLPFATGNSAGAVLGFNTGLQLFSSNIYAQFGASYGLYDFKGRTIDDPTQEDSLEQQTYITTGLFKRSDVCNGDRVSWAVVYDQFYGREYGWTADEITLGQFRALLGYALNHQNEVGVFGTWGIDDDIAGISSVGANVTTRVRPMNQLNTYFKHNWKFGATSMFYVGGFDNADVASWQFGLTNSVPLNHSLSLYTNTNYVVPGSRAGLPGAAEEQWNAQVGFAWTLGRKAVNPTISGRAGLPLLPVANNGSFLITN